MAQYKKGQIKKYLSISSKIEMEDICYSGLIPWSHKIDTIDIHAVCYNGNYIDKRIIYPDDIIILDLTKTPMIY